MLIQPISSQENTNVAIYIRVSTLEQAIEGFSIDAQRHNLNKSIQMRGKHIVKEYVDAGISGRSMRGRKALQQLLGDAKLGLFQEVVVWKFSRLARNVGDLLSIVKELEEHGVTIYSITESFETKSPTGQFLLQMMGAVAEVEISNIKDNVRHSLVKRVKEGHFHGIIPFGYRKNPATGEVEVYPEEAKIIREIFEAYEQGKGLKQITKELNQRGVRTLRGKYYHVVAIRRILHNANYIGKVRIKDKRNKEEIIVDGNHEAIINKELWDRVHMRYRNQSLKYGQSHRTTYLLNGLIKCPQCGGGMSLITSRDKNKDGTVREYPYYQCSRYYTMGNICKPNVIPQQKAEETVIGLLAEWLNQPLFIDGIIEDINLRSNEKLNQLIKELELLETEKRKYTQKEKETFKLFEEDGIDPDQFKENISLINNKGKEISEEIKKLRFRISKEKENKLLQRDIRERLEQFQEIIRSSSKKKLRELLEVLINKITINRERNIESLAIYIKKDVLPTNEPIIISYGGDEKAQRKVM